MSHTQCERATAVPNRARGHSLTELKAEIVEQKTHFIIGAGDVVSTADDMLKWDDALRGDGFLSVAAKKEMFTPHVRGKTGGMGYGWQIRERTNADPIHLFGGAGTGFRSLVVREPKKRLYLLLLGNCESPLDAEFAIALTGKIEAALEKKDQK
jgi:CubicO group peptidase (beta-lactamase class C family)